MAPRARVLIVLAPLAGTAPCGAAPKYANHPGHLSCKPLLHYLFQRLSCLHCYVSLSPRRWGALGDEIRWGLDGS